MKLNEQVCSSFLGWGTVSTIGQERFEVTYPNGKKAWYNLDDKQGVDYNDCLVFPAEYAEPKSFWNLWGML